MVQESVFSVPTWLGTQFSEQAIKPVGSTSGLPARRAKQRRSTCLQAFTRSSPTSAVSGSAATRASICTREPMCIRCPTGKARRQEPAPRSVRGARAERISVINPLHEPLIASDVVIELAQQCVVEHDLPVLADDRPVPP